MRSGRSSADPPTETIRPRRDASSTMSVSPLYDHEREIAAKGGNVVELWATADEWAFEVDGALALQPELDTSLKDPDSSVTVARMVEPQAPGVTTRAIRREEMRAQARRSRRRAALVVVACVSLVTLLLTAFGTGDRGSLPAGGAGPAERLLPAGPPQAQVVAMQDTLRIQLPVNQSRVTAIGYHAVGSSALALEPVGTQANAGLAERIIRKLFGSNGSSLRYYLLDGGIGPRTGSLDVKAPVDTNVYAPVDGSVLAVTDQVINGRAYGVRIDVQPSGNPGVVVSLTNLRPDPALTVGSTVRSGRTKVGRIIDLSGVERAGLARYTQDKGQHVHLEVHPAASVTSPS